MKILITGICGFVGCTLARELRKYRESVSIVGIDNLSRAGSETNVEPLQREGIDVRVGDIRVSADLTQFGKVDWVIDAAANPSVLAGVDGKTSASELLDQNLFGTVPILEYCREHQAAFTLLSTSRVYSINALKNIPLCVENKSYRFTGEVASPNVSVNGISEHFSTTPPLSLYGVSKLCAEQIAIEYGNVFQFPVWINRCGVMAGAGQFGNAEQGIFSYWIRSWKDRRPLKYLGFGGMGHQVRDCLNPRDLCSVLFSQFDCTSVETRPQTINLSGGVESAMSLAQLSEFCCGHIHYYNPIGDGAERAFDIPWIVLDNSLAGNVWKWSPKISIQETLLEIRDACQNP